MLSTEPFSVTADEIGAIGGLIGAAAGLIGVGLAIASYFSSRRSAAQAEKSAEQAEKSADLARRGLQATANQYSVELVLEASRFFIQYPQLRPFFFEDRPLEEAPTTTVRNRVEATALAQLDVMEAIWDHHGEFKKVDAEAWREWIHELFEHSPILRARYRETWYPNLTILRNEGCVADGAHTWPQSTELRSSPE